MAASVRHALPQRAISERTPDPLALPSGLTSSPPSLMMVGISLMHFSVLFVVLSSFSLLIIYIYASLKWASDAEGIVNIWDIRAMRRRRPLLASFSLAEKASSSCPGRRLLLASLYVMKRPFYISYILSIRALSRRRQPRLAISMCIFIASIAFSRTTSLKRYLLRLCHYRVAVGTRCLPRSPEVLVGIRRTLTGSLCLLRMALFM